jgi:hypothetical protein
MTNPVEYWQLQEVMSERPAPPEDDFQTTEDWEKDPDAWKDPDAVPSPTTSLLERFEELYLDESLLDGLKAPLSEASPEFFDLLKAHWSQLARDNSPELPLTADKDEYRQLSARDKALTAHRMNEAMRHVFDWMISQGKEPIQGWPQWRVEMPPEIEHLIEG